MREDREKGLRGEARVANDSGSMETGNFLCGIRVLEGLQTDELLDLYRIETGKTCKRATVCYMTMAPRRRLPERKRRPPTANSISSAPRKQTEHIPRSFAMS